MLTPTRDNFDRTKEIVRKLFGPDKFAVDSDLNEVGQAAEDLFARMLWLLIKQVNVRFSGWTFTGGTNSVTVAAGEAAVETYTDRAHVLNLASPEAVTGWTTPVGAGRTDYLYVDIEFEQIDPAGDATLINPAVGEETINDIRLAWAFAKQEGGSVPSAPAGHYYATIATITRSDGVDTITAGNITSQLDNYKTIEAPEIEDNSITLAKMADNSVGTVEIVDDSITLAKMANNSVDTPEIVDDAITEDKMAALSVATAALQDAAVTLAKMGDNSVDSPQLVDGSVDDVHLANNHVNTTGDTMTGNLTVPNVNLSTGGTVDGIDPSLLEIPIFNDNNDNGTDPTSNVGEYMISTEGVYNKRIVSFYRHENFNKIRLQCQARNSTTSGNNQIELAISVNDAGYASVLTPSVSNDGSWHYVNSVGNIPGSSEGDHLSIRIQLNGEPGYDFEARRMQITLVNSVT